MWFTIAFFSIPISIILLVQVFNKRRKNVKKKLIWAALLFLLPLICFIVELRNDQTIEKDLIGIFYSRDDTLVFQQNNIFLSKHLNKVTKRGEWNLNTDDQLIVYLKVNSRNEQPLELIYSNGLPVVKTNPFNQSKGIAREFKKLIN